MTCRAREKLSGRYFGVDLSVVGRYVRRMARAAHALESACRALGDPTRRKVLERLGRGAASVTELAGPFRMALPSFVQHMRVLERSGLVKSKKVGRVRTYELAPERLRVAEDWLSRQRAL